MIVSERGGLHTESGQQPTFKGIKVEGTLQGLLAKVKVAQTYENQTGADLEAIYTFPLAHDAVLLGMAVEINNEHLSAKVVPRAQAEQAYEDAIDRGDTPVLLETHGNGLYTANLGNLKCGERAVIVLEYAQLLRVEQGAIRFTVPTTIAPSYGDPMANGTLPAHASAEASLEAMHAFCIRLTLKGDIAKGTVNVSSHATCLESDGELFHVSHQGTHWMDRDFVLQIDGLASKSQVIRARGEDGASVILASYSTLIQTHDREGVQLKLLVDCSGSMSGSSIAQARHALHQVTAQLRPADCVSFGCFGSTSSFPIPHPLPATPQFLARLSVSIDELDADMGGTELCGALMACFGQATGSPAQPADVLLITDGQVWNVEAIVEAARNKSQRIFVIGVGMAPGESLLRQLAEASGGACEFVGPNESMERAVMRMFRRLKAGMAHSISVDWGGDPCWHSTVPPFLHHEQTTHIFARFTYQQSTVPCLQWESGGAVHQASVDVTEEGDYALLSRLAGATQMREASEAELQQQLALEHQLASNWTHFLLIHERADADKAGSHPALQQVRHMHAAGSHGLSRSFGAHAVRSMHSGASTAALWRRGGPEPALTDGQAKFYDVPAFLRKGAHLRSPAGGVSERLGSLYGTTDRTGKQSDAPGNLLLILLEFEATLAADTPSNALMSVDRQALSPQARRALRELEREWGEQVATALLLAEINTVQSGGKGLGEAALALIEAVLGPHWHVIEHLPVTEALRRALHNMNTGLIEDGS